LKHSGSHDVDVTIVGGGPAGAAAALALARRNYSTVVIERSQYESIRVGETLAPAVQPLLASLGVWERFLAAEHSPAFGVRSAWGHRRLRDNDFIFNPYGSGWHVDRARFDRMLADCAEEHGVTVYRGARVLSVDEAGGGMWVLEIAHSRRRRRLRTRFVVDATGRTSCIARALGAGRVSYDHLIGIFWFLKSPAAEAGPGVTCIEAAEEGWWYSAALPGSRGVTAYMTDADLYRDAAGRRHTVRRQSGLQGYVVESGPHVRPADTSRLDHATDRGWLAIGDAAMALDPLSGQGVLKALASALSAAQCIHEYFAGRASALQDYAVGVSTDFERNLQMRTAFYSREQRWPQSVFWRRRHAPAQPFGASRPSRRPLVQ
jgi:flavin-dependent dehydrogenase